MATFVTTSRMHPALVARIEASIRGKRSGDVGGVLLRRVVLWSRIIAFVLFAVAVVGFLRFRHQTKDALETSRATLLSKLDARVSAIPVDDRKIVGRIEPWLVRASSRYEGDVVAPELRDANGFSELLKKPLVYVHGPVTEFAGPVEIATAAATSFKDAFLLCLLEPPKERTEALLIQRVHGAYGGGPRLEARTANVHRLHEAEVGLRFFEPSWRQRVLSAKEAVDLTHLEHAFAAAPLDAAAQAGAARLLLYAMDEEGDRSVPAELDGERAHDVRVGLVDLAQGRALLRLRKRVDPGWISAQRRTEYASGLDACALAMDVLASVKQ